MKKNILFFLLLSVVAMFNCTSCQETDYDADGTYTYRKEKAEDRHSAFVSCAMSVGVTSEYYNAEEYAKIYATIEDYLNSQLGGLVEKVRVNASVYHILIRPQSGKEEAVANRLKQMSTDTSILTEQLDANFPEVKSLCFSISSYDQTSVVFTFRYKKNF